MNADERHDVVGVGYAVDGFARPLKLEQAPGQNISLHPSVFAAPWNCTGCLGETSFVLRKKSGERR